MDKLTQCKGQSPPGMQAVPEGSSKKLVAPEKKQTGCFGDLFRAFLKART